MENKYRFRGGSRPSRARGLKRNDMTEAIAKIQSRPSRARGLKRLHLSISKQYVHVAPLAGAWIETGAFQNIIDVITGRAPRGRVD